MKRVHPIVWGLIWSWVIAIITWFTFAGVMHELPLSPGLQILFFIHYPEAPAFKELAYIFQPHISPARFWIIALLVHFGYWLSIGAISGAIYSRIVGKH